MSAFFIRSFSKWQMLICLMGLLLGVFFPLEGEKELHWSSSNYWLQPTIGFIFFALGSGLATLMDTLKFKFKRNSSDSKKFRWGFFGNCGWLVLFLGIGMIISSTWLGSDRFWDALVNLASGAGLILGVVLMSKIIGRTN